MFSKSMIDRSHVPAIWIDPPELTPEQRAITEWPLLNRVLANRGFSTNSDIAALLAPRRAALADPWLLPDMHRALPCCESSLERGDRIAIFGDYDVDGISSTAMITRALRRKGATVIPLIPHRMRDGYGVTRTDCQPSPRCERAVTDHGRLWKQHSAEFVELEQAGIQSIILDHHAYTGTLPASCAFVSAQRPITPIHALRWLPLASPTHCCAPCWVTPKPRCISHTWR